MSSPPPPPQTTNDPQGANVIEQRLVRRLIVEVIDARDLLPKDGQGSSSPYVVVDFDGQRKRTTTKYRDLNPTWNEPLDFIVSDPNTMDFEELNAEVYHDKRMSPSGAGRKSHFLGRVKLYGSQFSRRGDEGLVYFPLEKKSVFSWIKGELGLRIYYFDDVIEVPPPQQGECGGGGGGGGPPPPEMAEVQPEQRREEVEQGRAVEVVQPMPTEAAMEASGNGPYPQGHGPPPQGMVVEEGHGPQGPPPEIIRRMAAAHKRAAPGEFAPRVISGKFVPETEKISAFDLVEPMQYLFVRIVKARGLTPNENPYIKIRTNSTQPPLRTKPATYRPGEPPENPEWQEVFAISSPSPSVAGTLEISIWDSATERFLGGVCFDLSDVPVRDPPDSPLAPQWYRLEGGEGISGDVQLAVWLGTQADDAFPEAWTSDAPPQQPSVSYTRAKVYQSPKLWYLRVTVIEAQDLHIPPNLPPLTAPEIRVKAQLGFQSLRTRRGSMSAHGGAAVHFNEDLILIAGEPLEEQLILLVENRTSKDPMLLGHAIIPVGSIEQRIDERHVAAKWAAHVCSDYRPTAKQLWKPPIGVLELGVLGARGLLPMKTKGPGKGSTDAYCVAKYGKKWVRTRTVTDSFDPRWNEQYTWQVYDPCTVLTIGVFDNWRMFTDPGEEKPDYRIGKVRIRVSTLESNKVYTNSYPLLVLLRTGLKKMGEIELAVRFVCPSLLPDTCGIYGQPLLPRMHYLRPLGVAQQEALRGAATKMVAAWLARSEPPLGPEVVRYMLDADSHTWSMRKSKANWFRIVAVLAWAIGLAKWLNHIRRWRNPLTTILVHILYLVLVWYPDLIVPTGFLYVFLIGIWYYRFRPKIPAGMDTRLSQAETVDPDDLDEEFDTVPSSTPPDLIRVRYDRLRILAARVQTVLGDLATQGERVQALVSWRDPRATKLFIGVAPPRRPWRPAEAARRLKELPESPFPGLHRLSFALDKSSGKKCYMLGARMLMISWGDTPAYWSWRFIPESRFPETAQLNSVCWLDIKGRIPIKFLSSDTTYGVYFVFQKVVHSFAGFYGPVKASVLEFDQEEQSKSNEDHSVVANDYYLGEQEFDEPTCWLDGDELPVERGDGWMEIEMGRYDVGSGVEAFDERVVLEMALMEVEDLRWKSGVLVQGIELRPLD
uniref:C2 domain-containing protein n=1 Tax=Chenopodium quinoa TaxID=63459 RepID=A0A803L922_CHEQI